MASNPALAELDRKANVGEAKRDLVLRFVRDQESLQTSQVDLKLVDDSTIDLIDSATNDEPNNDVVTGIRLDEGQPLAPRPPSGRPRSRRLHRTASQDGCNVHKLSLSKVQSIGSKLTTSEAVCRSLPTNSNTKDKFTRPISPPHVESISLNSSWPEQDFLSRKLSSRKYLLCSPDKKLDDIDSRPLSSISGKQNNDGLNSRSTSPTKRHRSRSQRTYMNLNIEPVHPSEIPLLRGRSASSSVSGPYTLVHLPPIQNTTPSM